jgi:hypothetical protein
MLLDSDTPQRKISVQVIRLTDLYNVLGRRLACRLLEAKYIVPTARDARGHPLFDAQTLHRSLGALARGIGLIEARTHPPGKRATCAKDELDSLLIDAEQLARLLE